MAEDTDILLLAQKTAKRLEEIDPKLEMPEHKGIREAAERLFEQKNGS